MMRVYYDDAGKILFTTNGMVSNCNCSFIEIEGQDINPLEWQVHEGGLVPSMPDPQAIRAALPPITRRQLRLTLVRNGIALDDVAGLIEALPEGLAKEEARIEWDDAQQFERMHPTLLIIAGNLGLTPEQVDQMWQEALEA